MGVLEGTRPAPGWVSDLALIERLGWTYDDLMEAPAWFVDRAALFYDVLERWKRSKQDQASK